MGLICIWVGHREKRSRADMVPEILGDVKNEYWARPNKIKKIYKSFLFGVIILFYFILCPHFNFLIQSNGRNRIKLTKSIMSTSLLEGTTHTLFSSLSLNQIEIVPVG